MLVVHRTFQLWRRGGGRTMTYDGAASAGGGETQHGHESFLLYTVSGGKHPLLLNYNLFENQGSVTHFVSCVTL
jgi:hypothetical protein